MYSMKELTEVQETKHLVPNLAVLAKALFGDNAYLTSKAPHQADWATGKFKIGDGLLWLPWLRQLWLIEVEWKEGSNFFDQSRAFAEGEVHKVRLSVQLEEVLDQFKEVLNQSNPALREGIITENIIKETLNNHILKGRLCPHGWVILGHSGNREKLRQDYEKELKSRFGGDKHYILSMARMFQGDFSSYILLEQYCSAGCQELLNVERSILVPSRKPIERPVDVGIVGIEDLYKSKKVSPSIKSLFENFDREVKSINEEIWLKVSKTMLGYYSPERVFNFTYFQKQAIRFDLFTRGEIIDAVKNFDRSKGGAKWGSIYLRKEEEQSKVLEAVKSSYRLIKEAIKNNEPTGWYAKIEEESKEISEPRKVLRRRKIIKI